MRTTIIAVLLSLFTVSCTSTNGQGKSFKNINTQEFKTFSKEKSVVIIDVRTAGEVKDGYIKGATLFLDVNQDFKEKIKTLDKNKTYLVYCRSGARSSNASAMMIEAGFSKVYNLSGGILGWDGEVVR